MEGLGLRTGGGCSTQDDGTWSACIGHEHRGGAAMQHFAGLDVSLDETAICVVDEAGTMVREARVPSEPEALVGFFQGSGLVLERIGLEACSLSAWLHESLVAAGLPTVCIETRRAKAAMGAMPNKTDGVDGPIGTIVPRRRLSPCRKDAIPMQISTIGIDLAKRVLKIHGVDRHGNIVLRRQLRRAQVLGFFAKLPPCLVGMEACGTSHYWARELTALGHEVRLMPPQYVKPYVK